jgi:hypothetical protein
LADGETLRAICRDEAVPDERTVRRWALEDEAFSPQYARACEIGYHHMADEILEIADTPKIGTKTVEKPSGTETTHGDVIEHRRLQVDTRKWLLSKVLPKVYGDKLTTELTGKDGGPIETESTPTPIEVAQRIALTLGIPAQEEEEQREGAKVVR